MLFVAAAHVPMPLPMHAHHSPPAGPQDAFFNPYYPPPCVPPHTNDASLLILTACLTTHHGEPGGDALVMGNTTSPAWTLLISALHSY